MGRRRGARVFRLALVLLALAGFWYFENKTIVTETFVLPSARLPAAFDGFRVVSLADLHGKSFGEGNEKLIAAVRDARPDLIAIDGDLADADTDLDVIRALAPELVRLAPVCYVTGNHEWAMPEREALFSILEEAGVTLLRNDYRPLERAGQVLIVAGVDDPNGPRDQKTPERLTEEIRAAHGDPYILLLAHRNDQLDRWAALSLDAVLAGHAHGGAVRLPGVGGLIGPGGTFFPDYTAGLYREGRTALLVSRGLGWSAAPLRLFNRPEVAVAVLQTVNNP